MRTPRFTGTTADCFAHLMHSNPTLGVVKKLANFCGASDIGVIERWATGTQRFAGGNDLVRLRCFLAAAGYEVTDLQRLSSNHQRLAFAIGFRIVSPEDVRSHLGYDKMESVWRIVILRAEGPVNAKDSEVKALAKRYGPEAEVRFAALQHELAPLLPKQTVDMSLEPDFNQALSVAVERMMAGLIPLLRIMARDSGTMQDFARRHGVTVSELKKLLG